jgi:hypothetical protein
MTPDKPPARAGARSTRAKPLPLEVKVYDPDRGRDAQSVRAASPRRSSTPTTTVARMAISLSFDASPDCLAVRGEDPDAHLPVVRSSGISVFTVVVPIGQTQSASGRKKPKRQTLTSAFLCADD